MVSKLPEKFHAWLILVVTIRNTRRNIDDSRSLPTEEDARTTHGMYFIRTLLKFCFLVKSIHVLAQKDELTRVYIKYTKTDGDSAAPCSMPKVVNIDVVLTNGTLFYKLKLHKREHVSTSLGPLYSIRSSSHLSLLPEKILPNQKSAMYTSFPDLELPMEVNCLQEGGQTPYLLNGIFSRNGMQYRLLPGKEGFHHMTLVPRPTERQHDYRVLPGVQIPPRIREAYNLTEIKIRFRGRRQVARPDVIDLLVVIDHGIYTSWYDRSQGSSQFAREQTTKSNIQTYYSHFLNEVDLRFQGIRASDLNFRVNVAALLLADRSDSYIWTEIKKEPGAPRALLNADEALKDFRSWVNNSHDLPAHDHAILFTGYNLYTSDGFQKKLHTAGLAFIGSMCRGGGDSVSVVEDHGGFQNIATATHEIGHSLGSLHDGENNACDPNNRFIMSSSENTNNMAPDKRTNQWHFSACSVNYFREFLANSNRNGIACFSNSLHVPLPSSTVPPGQLYSPDDQCKLIWGPRSYLCRGSEFGNVGSICTAMYCRDPNSGSDCVLHTAARGTSCGNKKWCEEGLCIFSERAPELDETCALGDQPGVAFINKTCDALINELPQYCYKEKVRARCCSSCSKHYSRVAGCEYGDRVLGCKDFHCDMVEDPNVLTDCCQTCSFGTVIPTTPLLDFSVRPYTTEKPTAHRPASCVDSAEINGLSCRNFVAESGRHACYNSRLSAYCCDTCRGHLNVRSPDCPYGNRLPEFCSQQVNVTERWCKNFRPYCCDTCAGSAPSLFPSPVVFMTLIALLLTLWHSHCILKIHPPALDMDPQLIQQTFKAAPLTTEFFLQGSVMENSLETLVNRLKGLCDNADYYQQETFQDHEMVFHIKNQSVPTPLVFRVRHSLVQPECWSLRYLGHAEVGDKNRPTLVRSYIDCPTSENVVQFIGELGFRMEHEFVVKGYYFHKGRMKITASKFYKMNQPGHTAVEAVDAICPSYLVELSVVTSSGQEGVGEDMKNFAEQLKPLVILEKTDHRKIQLGQT
uniref:Uncharacterized protein LOC111131411 n=1 Tax=Crassostrea virginica TaxID=6565 RepID=A0A8B8E4I8_CRAVI|nr:uncharacterized protein LOC111131411 [Crassostrea virginica]